MQRRNLIKARLSVDGCSGIADLLAFLHDRLKVYLRDQGIRHDVIDACLAMPNADDLTLLVKRAEALQAFLHTDDGENLIQGFKRAHNILKQAEEKDGVEYSYGPDAKLAETDEEKALFAALDAAEAKIAPAMEGRRFRHRDDRDGRVARADRCVSSKPCRSTPTVRSCAATV